MSCSSGFYSSVIYSSENSLLKSRLLPVMHVIVTSICILVKALVFSG